jgi:hypothetical protein
MSRNKPLDALVVIGADDPSAVLSGIAGSRGVRFFSKREQELNPWCGSNM